MILTGSQITARVQNGTISLSPFVPHLVNPNSYNYRLGVTLKVTDLDVIDPRLPQTWYPITIPAEGYVLQPGKLYLGHTYERIGSTSFVPSLIGRSSLGRLGMFLQITADLGHLGTDHCWTLEIKVVQPLRVYPKMRVGQVSFWMADGTDLVGDDEYLKKSNNYARHSGATPSNTSKFFE